MFFRQELGRWTLSQGRGFIFVAPSQDSFFPDFWTIKDCDGGTRGGGAGIAGGGRSGRGGGGGETAGEDFNFLEEDSETLITKSLAGEEVEERNKDLTFRLKSFHLGGEEASRRTLRKKRSGVVETEEYMEERAYASVPPLSGEVEAEEMRGKAWFWFQRVNILRDDATWCLLLLLTGEMLTDGGDVAGESEEE